MMVADHHITKEKMSLAATAGLSDTESDSIGPRTRKNMPAQLQRSLAWALYIRFSQGGHEYITHSGVP